MFPLPLPHPIFNVRILTIHVYHIVVIAIIFPIFPQQTTFHIISTLWSLRIPPDPSGPGRAEVVSSSDHFGIGRSTPGEAVHLGILSGGHCTLKFNPSLWLD